MKERVRPFEHILLLGVDMIQNIFGTSMDVEFQLLEKIDLAANGKLRKTISKIDSHALT